MMTLPFGLFTQVSGLGPLGPLVPNAIFTFLLYHADHSSNDQTVE